MKLTTDKKHRAASLLLFTERWPTNHCLFILNVSRRCCKRFPALQCYDAVDWVIRTVKSSPKLPTCCFRNSRLLKLFGILSLRLSVFCMKFCKFVGNSYSHISTNLCRSIQLFHQMALIFSTSTHRFSHVINDHAARCYQQLQLSSASQTDPAL